MFVTLVAVLCHVLPGARGDCVEEIVTDSSLSNITFQSCLIQGQIGIASWMSEHPIYRANWTLQRYKCAPGHYERALSPLKHPGAVACRQLASEDAEP